MTPDEYCRQKAAQSGSSLYYSFLYLAPQRRRAVTALHAFCREVDEVADECTDPGVARTKLAWWRDQVTQIHRGDPQHPVAKALVPAAREFNLPAEQLQEIIDGVEMDLSYTRYRDFKALQLYCYRVACIVELLSAEIFGYSDRRTLKYAHDLGLAFQLTRIIRDVGEDARRDRIYIPQDELARFAVPEQDLGQGRDSEAFRQLMAFQIERARQHYDQALEELPAADRKSQRAGLAMAAIQRTLLEEIRSDPGQVLKARVALTPVRKLWIAWKTWVTA